MYCSLDKIDLAAQIDGQPVAMQTDHRGRAEIEREPELSILFALARVLNARDHMADEGAPNAAIHYVVSEEPPELLRDALVAAGATLEITDHRREPRVGSTIELLGAPSERAASELADRMFAALARRTAARVGTRDLGMALRMLEDQTWTAPPARDDERAYWARVLELAALAGELLRAKHPDTGCWVHTDRAIVPFGFQVSTGESATVMFPTNRAQRLVEDGRDESLFKLLLAAQEALASPPDAVNGRLMPSLRARFTVETDDAIWRPLLVDQRARHDLPIVVCGVDGENTFGMMRKEVLGPSPDDAMERAIANLATEDVETEELHADGMVIVVVTGGFYAAEKLLDEAFMRSLHDELGAYMLAAATPARGLLLVTDAGESTHLARFAQIAQLRFDDSGGRAISPAVMLVTDGKVTGCVAEDRADTGPMRAETEPGSPRRGILKRLLGRK
ncbi:MAG: hypothetical protein ACKV2T_35130 [Kofleriaceae bacterium]